MNPKESGPEFIEEKYPDTADNKRPRLPVTERFEKISKNPRALERLENLLMDKFVLDTSNEATLQKLARALYESEKKIAIERGHGAQVAEIEPDEEEILAKYKDTILEKAEIQKRTLGSWFTYLKESQDYPVWFKYYVVRSLRDIGQFSRDEKDYATRTKDTIAPFPELNAESLTFVYKALEHEFEKENFHPDIGEVSLTPDEEAEIRGKVPEAKLEHALSGRLKNKRREARKEASDAFADEKDTAFVGEQPLNEERKSELSKELLERLKTKDFAKLYAFAQVECAGNLDRESLEGEWIKYDKGSDFHKLEDSLKGKGTGWCTASGSAKQHLEGGDFYVFYSKNKAGIPTEPRIAIRMQNDSIAEIRGVNFRQELEPLLVETAREKYKDLPGAQKYEKTDRDMKMMTTIYNKCFSVDKDTGEKKYLNPELSREELRFLYEIDSKIEGFGYDRDPRIIEILKARNQQKQDLSSIFNCKQEHIILSEREALERGAMEYMDFRNVIYFDGDISYNDLKEIGIDDLSLPRFINGDLELLDLKSLKGLILPARINGTLTLCNLTTIDKDLKLPEYLGGNLYIGTLRNAENVTFPEIIGGSLDLAELEYAKEVNLPKHVGKDFAIGIKSARGLKFPTIGGYLSMEKLETTDGLELPETVPGGIFVSREIMNSDFVSNNKDRYKFMLIGEE